MSRNRRIEPGWDRVQGLRRHRDMMGRCYDTKHASYATYGGRGIRVCQAWHDAETYYQDIGPPPLPDYQLDRIDNDGSYTPGNCQWASPALNALNRSQPDRGGCPPAHGVRSAANGKFVAFITHRRRQKTKTFAQLEDATAWRAREHQKLQASHAHEALPIPGALKA